MRNSDVYTENLESLQREPRSFTERIESLHRESQISAGEPRGSAERESIELLGTESRDC